MSALPRLRTKVSTKGQVVLPRAIRDQPGFGPGAELDVKVVDGVVTLAPVKIRGRYTLDDLVGIVPYDGPTLTIEDMDRAIDAEVQARRARGRY